jgi:L-fuculokinase
MKVTAVFDIGKTNKKLLLFDENYQEVFQSYVQFPEMEDEDGFPCDDLSAIQKWIKTAFQEVSDHPSFNIQAVNFSAYGASFVHLDKKGKVVAPLYNYLKPYPEDLLHSFYEKHGSALSLATETASPPLGMLNSGLQLYWLKYARPELFKKIRWSLHLPQYLSYLFTGMPLSDYTSIGCHTMLWDYDRQDYHAWVYAEGIDQVLAPIVPTNTSMNRRIRGKTYTIGAGMHDSSAALLPYLSISSEPFILLSTGTWSISLNPFNDAPLTSEELNRDCLNFLSIDGKMIKAARLFLGNEYKIWIHRLSEHFHQPLDRHQSITPDPLILKSLSSRPKNRFRWESMDAPAPSSQATDLSQFENYETAYHQLMQELAQRQVKAIRLALGKTSVKKIFMDGGFLDNRLFIHFLAQEFPDFELIASQKPLGSAIGAAIVMNEPELVQSLLLNNFKLQNCRSKTL